MPFPTLQEHKDSCSPIYAYCGNNLCKHGERLDVDMLIARFGPDFEVSAYTLNRRLRCTKCGGKECRINVPGDQRSSLQKQNGGSR